MKNEYTEDQLKAINNKSCSDLCDFWDENWIACPICNIQRDPIDFIWIHKDP